uniref:Uncharacterized protein n=1 Tax=Caenorhabditis japonica TaxID=281687 RepID=A0A8R1EIC5_CAEJA
MHAQCVSCNEDEFRLDESSDIDRSPASPIRHFSSAKKAQSNKNKKTKAVGKEEKSKKGQRRLGKDVKEEPAQQQEVQKQKRAVNHHDAGDGAHHEHEDTNHHEEEAYDKSDSPGLVSHNSEIFDQNTTIGVDMADTGSYMAISR